MNLTLVHVLKWRRKEKERKPVVVWSGRLRLLGVWDLWSILDVVDFTLYHFLKEETTYNPEYKDLNSDFSKFV